ncbi:MAG TPA: GNAT family N-acetyltransferase [Deltaproteobacteria bacterium]|nr:GNAT family N-acetyltransferase [Deltaproteobacteria bacterium]
MLHQFTHVDYKTGFALVALIEENGIQAIIAVGRYMHDPLEDNTDLALAVRDDWQNLGLGKALLTRIITIAKENGISRFTSMMDTRNTMMEKILRDLGYEVKYFLKSGSYQVEVLV